MSMEEIDALIEKHLIGTHDQDDHKRSQHGTKKDPTRLTTGQRRNRAAGLDPAAIARGTSYTGLNREGGKLKNLSRKHPMNRLAEKPDSDAKGAALSSGVGGALVGGVAGGMAGAPGGKKGIVRGALGGAAAAGAYQAGAGAIGGAASDVVRRRRKKKGNDVSKALELGTAARESVVEKAAGYRALDDALKLSRKASKPTRRASGAIRNAGSKVGPAARKARIGSGKAVGRTGKKIQSAGTPTAQKVGGALRRAGGEIGSGSRRARRAAAGAAGAGAVGAGAYGLNERRKREKNRFGKSEEYGDHIYEIAKNFAAARQAGEIGHEYDLTTDPDLYEHVQSRLISKNVEHKGDDIEEIYKEMGGDWVPVEDVLVEMAKALWDEDEETAELIAYALS